MAVPHLDRPCTDRGRLGVMRDHNDRLVEFLVEFTEHLKDDRRIFGVEIARRLIRENDRRTVDHGTSKRDPLLLTAR